MAIIEKEKEKKNYHFYNGYFKRIKDKCYIF